MQTTSQTTFESAAFSNALSFVLDYAAHGGAEVGECLKAAGQVRDGDLESWYTAWIDLAGQVRHRATTDLTAGDTRAAGDGLLRAACYYRTAGRFLGDDPRHLTAIRSGDACFRRAVRLMKPACEEINITFRGESHAGHFYRAAAGSDVSRPTLLVIGVEGTPAQELYFACAVAALRNDWNCAAFACEPGHDTEEIMWALLESSRTLPGVDASCCAVLAFQKTTVPASDAPCRLVCPLAIGSFDSIKASLRNAETRLVPPCTTIADGESGSSSPSGALERLHRGLTCWMQGDGGDLPQHFVPVR
jgi:hypothetical protein